MSKVGKANGSSTGLQAELNLDEAADATAEKMAKSRDRKARRTISAKSDARASGRAPVDETAGPAPDKAAPPAAKTKGAPKAATTSAPPDPKPAAPALEPDPPVTAAPQPPAPASAGETPPDAPAGESLRVLRLVNDAEGCWKELEGGERVTLSEAEWHAELARHFRREAPAGD